MLVAFADQLRARGAGRRLGRRAHLLRGHGAARPDRPARPVLGRTHHDGHPPRPDPGLRPGVPAVLPRRGATRCPSRCKLTIRAAAETAVGAAGAGDRARHGRPGRAGGPARPGRLGRRGAAEQGVRGLHARGAGRAAADHGADAARPAAAADPAHDRPRRGPAARPAPHGARDDAHARRAVEAVLAPAPAAAAAADPDPRRLGLDGRLLAAPAAVRLLGQARRRTRVEVFCFGTRLTRITRALERRRVDDAMEQAARAVFDWEGGTRIGDSPRHVRPGLGTARRVPGRDRGDLLRRAGPRRPAGAGRPRWSGCRGCATGWCG